MQIHGRLTAEQLDFIGENLSIEEIGNTMRVSYLMAAAGSILGGLFTEYAINRSSINFGRKASIVIGSSLIIFAFAGIILFVKETNFMLFIYFAGFGIGNI